MPISVLDIDVLPTEDLSLSWVIPEGGDALDLTGASLTLTVRPSYDSTVELVTLSTANGLLWIDEDDPTSGTWGITVEQSVVAEWPTGSFVHVITVDEIAGIREVGRGRFTVEPGRTTSFEPVSVGALQRLVGRSDADLVMPLELRDRNVPVDLTGWVLTLSVRAAGDRRDALLSVGVSAALARLGRLRLALTAAQLDMLPIETTWTLTGTKDGASRLFLSGSLLVDPRIWRDGFAVPVSLAGTTQADLTVLRSEDLVRRWQLVDRDQRVVDLAAYSARLVVRPTYDDPALIASYEVGTGLINRGDGVLELASTFASVNSLPIGNWRYILIVNGPTGQTEIARGAFDVRPGNISTQPFALLQNDSIARLQLTESAIGPRIEARQSADFRFQFRIMDGVLPRDVAAFSARLLIRPSFGAPEIITYFETGSQITMSSGGIVSVAVGQSAIAALPAGEYVYILSLNGPGGLFEPARGQFAILPGNISVSAPIIPLGDVTPQLPYERSTSLAITARKSSVLRLTWRVMNGKVPLNITSFSARLIVLPSFSWLGEPIQRFGTDTSGVYITDGPAGLLSVSVNQEAIAALPTGAWVFILILNSSDGIHEIARGSFTILPGKL